MVDVLKQARALIEQPKAWARGDMSTDRFGHQVPLHSREACRFCLYGALLRVLGMRSDDALPISVTSAVRRAILRRPYVRHEMHIVSFNDWPRTTHEDVLAVLDGAIAKEGGGGDAA